MAGRHTLREFLMFRALINRDPRASRTVEKLLAANPGWNPEEKRSWEAWKEADLPVRALSRRIERATVNEEIL